MDLARRCSARACLENGSSTRVAFGEASKTRLESFPFCCLETSLLIRCATPGLGSKRPPIRSCPRERVMISSDSGSGLGYLRPHLAMYRLIDLVDADTREWIAHRTVESILPTR